MGPVICFSCALRLPAYAAGYQWPGLAAKPNTAIHCRTPSCVRHARTAWRLSAKKVPGTSPFRLALSLSYWPELNRRVQARPSSPASSSTSGGAQKATPSARTEDQHPVHTSSPGYAIAPATAVRPALSPKPHLANKASRPANQQCRSAHDHGEKHVPRQAHRHQASKHEHHDVHVHLAE